MFRADIASVVLTAEEFRKSKAGRKLIDVLVLFRLLVLQSLYNLSDEEVEYPGARPVVVHALSRVGL